MAISRYQYVPSLDAAVVVAILYGIACFLTFFLWVRHRAWVWFVMVWASAMEALGYIIRIASTQNVTNKTLYILQFTLVVLAPVLMAAACYVIFARIFYNIVPAKDRTAKLLWVPPRFLTPIFVICDIVALIIQLIGAVIVASITPTDSNAVSKANLGKNIALAGLSIQIACFGLFSVIAVRFNFTYKRFDAAYESRISTSPGEKYCTIDGGTRKLKRNWPALLRCINIACVLILIRSIYRVCDFSLGRTGYTEEHEWCAYVFDALPIYPCVAMFIYWHPAKYLPYLGFRLPRHARQAA